ncbi:hypothetical protein EOC93_24450 [Mesorhizobium sp. M6A.T.Ce.TU.002.03.1.1]|uniref:hypothetical protein n=1 Tax=Mesorhizobium sp. M6A.T.Ce.TU.002.03.1.1 TaxID=2496782 RepID=UPI000FC9E739|nr:hypothetical protein EOC93_24450 [Mesorhizobium sp. M6A.T.Ce.TU.002.03.1.1]
MGGVIQRIADKFDRVYFWYEAGPTGYGLYLLIRSFGHECTVIDRLYPNLEEVQDQITTSRFFPPKPAMTDPFPDDIDEVIWDEASTRADAICCFLKRNPEGAKAGDVAELAAALGLSLSSRAPAARTPPRPATRPVRGHAEACAED